MIAQILIQEIKHLSKKATKEELEQSYFIALEKLSEKDLSIIRDSYLKETQPCLMPDLEHLY